MFLMIVLIANQKRLPGFIDSDYTVEEGEYFVDNLVVMDGANLTISQVFNTIKRKYTSIKLV